MLLEARKLTPRLCNPCFSLSRRPAPRLLLRWKAQAYLYQKAPIFNFLFSSTRPPLKGELGGVSVWGEGELPAVSSCSCPRPGSGARPRGCAEPGPHLCARDARAHICFRRGGEGVWRPFQDRPLALPCLSALFPKHSCGRSYDEVFRPFHSTQYTHLEVRPCLENNSGVGGFSAKGRLPERQARK